MSDHELLEKARQEHCRLLRVIEEKNIMIAMLKEPMALVRESIDMFCHPDLRDSARKWLSKIEA